MLLLFAKWGILWKTKTVKEKVQKQPPRLTRAYASGGSIHWLKRRSFCGAAEKRSTDMRRGDLLEYESAEDISSAVMK